MLIVVTNQPDVGRGTQHKSVVEAMHELLKSELPLDAIYVCYHGYDGECQCRKPKPGMLIEAAKKYDIDLKQSYMVGDRLNDIQAGLAGGCCTVFIDYGYCELLNTIPDFTTDTLPERSYMDPSTRPYLSVILTSFNESHHLDRILQDLAKQSYPDEKFELLILEAGEKNEDRVREKLGNRQSLLKYYHVPALSPSLA